MSLSYWPGFSVQTKGGAGHLRDPGKKCSEYRGAGSIVCMSVKHEKAESSRHYQSASSGRMFVFVNPGSRNAAGLGIIG